MEPREVRRLLSDVAQLERVLASAETGVAAMAAKREQAMADCDAAEAKAAAYLEDVLRQLAEAREAATAVTPEMAADAGMSGVLHLAHAEVAEAEVKAG